MLRARDRQLDIPPRYLAQLPWIGPILGHLSGSGQELYIGGGADPLLGEALAAAFVPVVCQGEHFVRAPSRGWVRPIRGDGSGRFRLRARTEWWQAGIDGVLMILLYDRSTGLRELSDPKKRHGDRGFPDTWDGQLQALEATTSAAGFGEIEKLPREMHGEIERRIGQLLEQPAKNLELGLIELDTRAVPSEINFAVASCQYPAGFLDGDIAERSYRRLRKCVEDPASRPRCLLLLGDQVYIDATAGLFDPSTLSDRYDLPYERLLRMEPLRHVLRRVPAYTMLDDHEIEDNWEPGSGSAENLAKGRSYYLAYQRLAFPPPTSPAQLWYQFDVDGFPFFMADTRTEREARAVGNIGTARIMNDKQLDGLMVWLNAQAGSDVPKFIASPASFLPRHLKATHDDQRAGSLRSDAWDGYPASFHALVDHIARKGIRNVVFLSGDEHISFATTALIRARDSGNELARILSIHSSGLYAPFAFANSTLDNLARREIFPSGDYSCEVSTEFAAPGDGFARLRVWRENGRWAVHCSFDREPPSQSPAKRFDLA